MKYTADYLIKKRKEKWNENHDVEKDRELRNAIANELVENRELLNEIINNPEKLIELVFVVVDKEQKTSPFFFNDVQKEFLKILNKAISDYNCGLITDISLLVLKGRQQGFTTLVTAYQMAFDITHKNFQGFTLADCSENTEAIFQNKAKFPYSQLPNELKPSEKFNNKRQLLFEKINSSWSVDTATENVGRSKTVNFFHGSECAFWKCGIASIQAALGEAFTKNCIKIYESTANGYNDYQTMWESGEYINCFFEWWKTKEYRIRFENEKIKKDFLQNIAKVDNWIFNRLRWLKNDKHLKEEQLYWYYKKYQKYIDKELIKQEYPCTPQEAFLLPGKTVFDTEILLSRLANIPKPIKIGYFTYKLENNKVSEIKWINDASGCIKIYRLPDSPIQTKYCVGGDTAGGNRDGDFNTGHVLDAKTGEQVAVIKNRLDMDLHTLQMYCLGKYYSYKNRNNIKEEALMCIEANFDSYPNRKLQELEYKNFYVREDFDKTAGKMQKKIGFRTTSTTRPTIISNLVSVVRENPESINDEDTIKELLSIVRNDEGRIEAPQGGHDDHMMGLAISHEARNQVIYKKDPIKVYPEFNFEIEKEKYDYGEEIIVV